MREGVDIGISWIFLITGRDWMTFCKNLGV